MNIVFISALEGGKYSGPLHSVPKQVISQSEFNSVYWVNLTNVNFCEEIDSNFYNFIPFRKFKIEKLPKPFCNPDLVVFEEFFKIECCLIAKKLRNKNIPYVIVPRCQMTKKYFENKKLKKKIASLLLFSKFAKGASSVQFLSNQELEDSIFYYTGNKNIIPNGIDIPNEKRISIKNNKIQFTFIGRYSIWQKGLDLLIIAISKISNELRKNNVKFCLYGPDERTGSKDKIKQLVDKYNVSDLIDVNGPVFGKDKVNVLKNTTIFIHTSRFEGMPMAVLEALSYSIPCFVTQGSNMREVIEKYEAGWGCNTTIYDIEKQLLNAINDISLIEKKGENALKLAKKYSWNYISKESSIWYKKIIEEKKQNECN